MTWLPIQAHGDTEFDRIFSLRPDLHADFEAYVRLIEDGSGLDRALLTLCSVRIAQILGGGAQSTAVDLPPAQAAALDAWRSSAAFSDRERACLAFAEKFVLDPHGITDADAAAVSGYLSPPEMVAFVQALAIYDGFTRFRLILEIGGKD